MEWLSGWLKQLILLILLASFIDLLLPSQAMQRYVKTVIGLFLLLILMNPLLKLFERNWSPDKLMADAEALQRKSEVSRYAGVGTGTGTGNHSSLEAIMAESVKLKSDNAAEARKLTENVLAGEIKAGVEQETGEQVSSVKVSITVDDKGNPAVNQVQVHLSHRPSADKPADARPAAAAIGRFEPVAVDKVKPVTVDIRGTGSTEESGEVKPASKEDSAAEERAKAVVRYIQKDWKVKADRIRVSVQDKA